MFRTVLLMQWKTIRWALLLAAVVGFTIPLLSIQWFLFSPDMFLRSGDDVALALETARALGIAYPILAGAVGLLMATAAWRPDHRGDHVYALSLPIPRWNYVLLQYAAGAVLVTIPVLAVGAGSVLASNVAAIPVGLSAYPLGLTIRFLLATLLAFSMFFAVSAGTARTAGFILAAIAGVLISQFVFAVAGSDANLVSPIVDGVLQWPGPFDVFGGRWMLIDV